MELWDRVEAATERFSGRVFEISDWMAQNPELSGEEHRACEMHCEFLESAGFKVTRPYCGVETGYDAAFWGTSPGPVVVLMAEYDALPGVGHACGHNVHGAMSLLAGALVASVMDSVPGTIRVVGTPAEEGYGGKIIMAQRGAFDNVSLAAMIHSTAGQSYVPYRALAMCAYEFVFQGAPSHASSSPWDGRNALNGVRAMFDMLDMMRQHVRPEVRIHGIITDGGTYPNIVPDKAAAKFYFRAPTKAMLEEIKDKAFQCATAAAMATGTSVTWQLFENPAADIKPDTAAELMMEKIYDHFGIKKTPPMAAENSTDVGDVSYCCPTVQPLLDVADGREYALHTREFAEICASPQVHRHIVTGAKILVTAALSVLMK